jgi:basic amino acid/polyamine antiporter, APA family
MSYWTRKSISELEAQSLEGHHQLKRTLGSFDLIMLGIGCIIGPGLFSITGIAAADHAGPAIAIAFVIAAIGCALAGLCYAELAAMIPIAGSAYTYAYATMGELAAWIIGWDLILEYAIGASTVSISWSAYLVSLLQEFGIHLPSAILASPWQPVSLPNGSVEYGLINLPAAAIVMIISLILIVGIKQSALFNSLMVIIKVSVVLAFIGVGFLYINYDNYVPFLPPNTGTFGEFGISGLIRAAGILFFAYIGFDAVSTAAQEAKQPQKSVPIGMLGSLAISTLLYILFGLVLTGIVPYTELNVAAPVALAIDKTPFDWLQWLVKVAILAGLTSVILVLLLGQSRILFAMARDGLLPKTFSQIHPRFHTPWLTNLALMLFVGLFGAFAPIWTVGSMTSIGTLLAFCIVCFGVLILRYVEPELPRPFRTPLVPFVPIAGILVCLGLMLALGLGTWLRLIIWLFIGLAIYFYYGRFHR